MKLVSLENLSKYNELLSQKTVRSVNSVKPDSTGNVTLGTEKSTFNKVEFDTGYFSIDIEKNYNFDLTGTDIENVSKENVNIRLVAKVTTAYNGFEVGDIVQLTTAVDNGYNYGNFDVCAYIRGNTLYVCSGSNPSLSVYNGTGWLEKLKVQIKAVLTAFVPDDGSILLIAEDQDNTSKLIGLPDGTLTWKDKNLVRSVNGVNADENGNVTISSLIPNQIIQSPVPLTDANLHLLDGALLSGDGVYADYVAMMGSLHDADPTATCWTTESDWQTSVTTYGECGKFVYDSVNNTLRLPKLTSFVQATSSANELGSLVEAGLPNITGSRVNWFMGSNSRGWTDGAIYPHPKAENIPVTVDANNWYEGTVGIKFDASRSNPIYGNSNTVQPQAIKYYFYIVVGTVSKTDIQIDIDNVLTDLNGKADTDLSNVPNSKGILVESYVNGTSWYRVYSDGWCEQGGCILENGVRQVRQVTFVKPFGNTYYTVSGIHCRTQGAVATADIGAIGTSTVTATGFEIWQYQDQRTYWTACGYIS